MAGCIAGHFIVKWAGLFLSYNHQGSASASIIVVITNHVLFFQQAVIQEYILLG
jgi:hypothetical protein